MSKLHMRTVAVGLTLGALALSASLGTEARAQQLDSQAVQALRRSMEYVGALQQFSVQARSFREDLLGSGHRVDAEMLGTVTVSRPDKLRGERRDSQHQILYYDGATVTLSNPPMNVYATVPAPGTIDEMFTFAQSSLGLDIPLSDLIWQNAFPLLMQDVTLAVVVGKEIIGGVSCDHLLFSRPGVDFQIWVADSEAPLPVKYVITDTGTPALLSIVALMTDWNIAPEAPAAFFSFVPLQGAQEIPFSRLDTSDEQSR